MLVTVKKTLLKIDDVVFGGKLVEIYRKWKESKEKNFFRKKKAVVLSQSVADMILMQLDHHDNEFLRNCFFDVAVRYLFVEQYYDKNIYGFDLYKKMHTLRGNYGQMNLSEEFYKKCRAHNKTANHGRVREEHSIEQFKKLIASYEENGYDENSVIMADKNLLSINGSHRIALALYRNQEFISTEVHNKTFKRAYSLDWFWESGFSVEEIMLIDETMKKIINEAKEQIGDFYCVLFPPAENYFDEIIADMEKLAPDNISVDNYEDFEWEVPDFIGFLKGVYFFDSISQPNFERKLHYILRASEIRNNKVRFRVVSLKINNPMYRLKKDNGMPESVATVRLKEVIRGRYRSREEKFTKHYVGDYAHDVIIHSSDNYVSNKAFRVLQSISKDISELFIRLNQYSYAIVETSADKISMNFPYSYYFNEDIDILVYGHDIEKIAEITEEFFCCKYGRNNFEITNYTTDYGKRVKVTYKGFMVIMFDFMTTLPGVEEHLIKRMIEQREYGEFFHLSLENEIIARLAKYIWNPSKKWHKEFIVSNITKVKLELIEFNGFMDENKAREEWKKIVEVTE